MRNSLLDIRPLTGAVGAEILDIDLAAPQPDQAWREIGQALSDWGVIFFRDQELTPEQQMVFANHLGTISANPNYKKVDGYEDLEEIRKEPEQRDNIGGAWHTDQTFRERPTRGTILYAREVPDFGGDTLFISMAKAYESLSDGLKHTLEGLRARHSELRTFLKAKGGSDAGYGASGRAPREAYHPVVIKLPENGRRVLFVNPSKTIDFEGWTEEESRNLLEFLFRHSERPEFMCRFRWREGSMAMWDNYQTWHYATNDYHGKRRVMHRLTVEMEMYQ